MKVFRSDVKRQAALLALKADERALLATWMGKPGRPTEAEATQLAAIRKEIGEVKRAKIAWFNGGMGAW